MNRIYKDQVRLLLHILPLIYKETDFAIHGGTAINLFVKNNFSEAKKYLIEAIELDDKIDFANELLNIIQSNNNN